MEIASDLGPAFGKHLVMQSCWIHTDNWRFPIYGWPRIQIYLLDKLYGYGSIPINTIFSGMNIHLPAILGFTRYQGFDPSPYII